MVPLIARPAAMSPTAIQIGVGLNWPFGSGAKTKTTLAAPASAVAKMFGSQVSLLLTGVAQR